MANFDLENVQDDFLAFSWENLPPWDQAKIMADSAKTVWIFGAGASHHYDLNLHGVPVPLANGFFNAFHALRVTQGQKRGQSMNLGISLVF
jgi:hypothetical protein